jgi:hypothetical protein
MEAAPFLPTLVERRAPFFSFIKNHRFFYVEKNGERLGFFYSKNLIKTPSNCGRSGFRDHVVISKKFYVGIIKNNSVHKNRSSTCGG